MKFIDSGEPYENLAAAIILCAVKDYKRALIRLKRNPESRSAQNAVRAGERFFYSSWYEILTDLDPDYLIPKLKEMVDEEY